MHGTGGKGRKKADQTNYRTAMPLGLRDRSSRMYTCRPSASPAHLSVLCVQRSCQEHSPQGTQRLAGDAEDCASRRLKDDNSLTTKAHLAVPPADRRIEACASAASPDDARHPGPEWADMIQVASKTA